MDPDCLCSSVCDRWVESIVQNQSTLWGTGTSRTRTGERNGVSTCFFVGSFPVSLCQWGPVYSQHKALSPRFKYLAFAEGGPSLKMQSFFIFWGVRDGDWLGLFTWSFRDNLARLTRSAALLSSPKRAECFRVCFRCDFIIVTLNRS